MDTPKIFAAYPILRTEGTRRAGQPAGAYPFLRDYSAAGVSIRGTPRTRFCERRPGACRPALQHCVPVSAKRGDAAASCVPSGRGA
ncbi:hypothetical protein CBM2609_B10111 [Cupriavidus taiwanensis]|nr:hypothetical protein CBM2609_B10111 [Cupriavidus taiwanensis]